MVEQIKVCGCSHKCAWSLLLILQLASIGLVVASVLVPQFFSYQSIKLALYKCNDSNFCSYSSYTDNANSICGFFSSSSGCKLFRGFEYGMIAYVVCAGVAVISTIIWILPSFCFIGRKNCFGCGLFLGFIAMSAQIAGVISYIVITNLQFSNCNALPDGTSQPSICPEYGIELGIAAAALYVFLMLIYLIFGTTTKKSLLRTNNDNQNMTHTKNQSFDQLQEERNKNVKNAFSKD